MSDPFEKSRAALAALEAKHLHEEARENAARVELERIQGLGDQAALEEALATPHARVIRASTTAALIMALVSGRVEIEGILASDVKDVTAAVRAVLHTAVLAAYEIDRRFPVPA
jgi:hypothetical protein